MIGTKSLEIQRQLNFSPDAGREVDRMGLQILKGTNFDTFGTVAFFGRFQAAGFISFQ